MSAYQPLPVDSFEALGIQELGNDEDGDLVSDLSIGTEHQGDSDHTLLLLGWWCLRHDEQRCY